MKWLIQDSFITEKGSYMAFRYSIKVINKEKSLEFIRNSVRDLNDSLQHFLIAIFNCLMVFTFRLQATVDYLPEQLNTFSNEYSAI